MAQRSTLSTALIEAHDRRGAELAENPVKAVIVGKDALGHDRSIACRQWS